MINVFIYEAVDTCNNVCIYNGGHKSSLIEELLEYIEYQNDIDQNSISIQDVQSLNKSALKRLSIEIFTNEV